MHNLFRGLVISAMSLLALAATTKAQNPQGVPQHPPNRFEKQTNDDGGGAAPVHDLSGSWVGPTESKLSKDVAPMTALGQKMFSLNKPDPFSQGSNDPWATCDPFGMPRSADNETRGIAFAQMPGRVVVMTQYQKIWREVWMDGRALPTQIGAADGPDPRWYGYSVGHWDGDNTLVVETTGMNASSWVDRRGYPHSITAHVEERYTRANHNNLGLTVTIDDPKMYTKPWVVATNQFKWIPDQADEEQLCVPSEALLYLSNVAIPADEDQATGKKK